MTSASAAAAAGAPSMVLSSASISSSVGSCVDIKCRTPASAYEFSTSAWAADPTTTVEKTLVKDLVPYLEAPGGLLYEKIEGMALMDDGNVYVCNDNDGVDDNSGETQLLNVGGIL